MKTCVSKAKARHVLKLNGLPKDDVIESVWL